MECSKCKITKTPEWYKSNGKLLVCQDCHTDTYEVRE